MLRLLKIAILTIFVTTASAQQIVVDETFTKLNTSHYVSLHKDHSLSLRIEDFLSENKNYSFTKNTSNSIKNKRSPGSNIWIQMSLRNVSGQAMDLRLVARSDALLYTLYEIKEGKLINEYSSGLNIANVDKPLQHNSVAFPIRLPPNGSRLLYIKSNSDHIANEIFSLENISVYDRSNIHLGLRLGGVFSFLFLAALISIILFLVTKTKIHLYYSLYATSNAITFFIATRMLQFTVIPELSTGHIPQFVGALITSVFFLRFIQEYYSSQGRLRFKKIIFFAYCTLMILFIILILASTIVDPPININPIWERVPMLTLSIMCLYAYAMIIQFAIKKPSWNNTLLLIAFFAILFASAITVVVRNGIIQAAFLANSSYEIALLLEFTILSAVLVKNLVSAYSQRAILRTQLLSQKKELKQAGLIKIALEEKDTLLREIHHRVKNNLQVISALLTLQSKYVKDDLAIEALQEGQGRVESMALIHQDLYQHDSLKGVNTKDYFEKLIDNLIDTYNTEDRNIQVECVIEPLLLDVDTMIPLGLVVNELTSNALKHAFAERKNGNIKISLMEEGAKLRLIVEDDGQGANRADLENKSFGFSLIKSFARRLDAELIIENDNGLSVELLINNYQKAA